MCTTSFPNEADYNVADILFKDGNAGMIINGDWSWAGYMNAGLDIGVAPLPRITSTGLWCRADGLAERILHQCQHLRGETPLGDRAHPVPDGPGEPAGVGEGTLYDAHASRRCSRGRSCRAMRSCAIQRSRSSGAGPCRSCRKCGRSGMQCGPEYQAVLAGRVSAEQAAQEMQAMALRRIKEMNE